MQCMHESAQSHLAAAAQQLIVDGKARHPLGLATRLGLGDRHQGNQVSCSLVAVELQAAQVPLPAMLVL